MNRTLALIVLAAVPTSAYAYVDPGSGLLVWQGVLALLGGLILFFRNPVKFLKNLLEKFRNR